MLEKQAICNDQLEKSTLKLFSPSCSTNVLILIAYKPLKWFVFLSTFQISPVAIVETDQFTLVQQVRKEYVFCLAFSSLLPKIEQNHEAWAMILFYE